MPPRHPHPRDISMLETPAMENGELTVQVIPFGHFTVSTCSCPTCLECLTGLFTKVTIIHTPTTEKTTDHIMEKTINTEQMVPL